MSSAGKKFFVSVWTILSVAALVSILSHHSAGASAFAYSPKYLLFIVIFLIPSAAVYITSLNHRISNRSAALIELIVVIVLLVLYRYSRTRLDLAFPHAMLIQALFLAVWKVPGWWRRDTSVPSSWRQDLTSFASLTWKGILAYKYLIIAILLALCLDGLFYTGYFGNDDAMYLRTAHSFSQLERGFVFQDNAILFPGGESVTHPGGLRFILTIPIAVIHGLTAGSLFWVNLYFICYHLGLVVLAYLLGRLIHDRVVAVAAAFLTAVCPLFFCFAGCVLADLAIAFWAVASACLLLYFYQNRASLTGRRKAVVLFCAGIALGLCYSAKMFGLIMVVPSAILIIFASRRPVSLETLRHGLYFLVGILVVVAIEAGLVYWLFDKLELRFQIAQGNDPSRPRWIQRMVRQGALPHERFVTLYRMMLHYLPRFPLWLYIGALVIYPFRRGAGFFLWLFAMWPLVYTTIGSVSPTSYTPPPIIPRYYTMVMVPASVALAALLWSILKYLIGKATHKPPAFSGAAVSLLVLIILIVSLSNFRTNIGDAGNFGNAEKVRSMLSAMKQVEERYPLYPVLLSPGGNGYSSIMGPLFLGHKPDNLIILKQLPKKETKIKPPFIILGSLRDRNDRQDVLPLVEKDAQSSVSIRVIEVVYPQRSRWQEIKNAANGLFAFPGRLKNQPLPTPNGTAIVLVEQTDNAGYEGVLFPAKGNRLPLAWASPRDKRILVQPYKEGYLVGWSDQAPPQVAIDSFFRAPEAAPDGFLTSFPPQSGRFVLRAGLVNLLENKGEIGLEVRLLLYNDRQLTASGGKQISRLGPDQNNIELAVETQEEVNKFRVQFFLTPKKNEAGRIYLSGVELSSPPAGRAVASR